MKPAAGLVFALAMAGPAVARGMPDDMKPRSTGLSASAIPTAQGGTGALDEGRALLLRNDPAQALSAFQVALAQAPESVAALNGMGIAYDRLGRSDLARQHFEMALALEPDAADIAYNLGLALVHAGDDRAAIVPLQRAAAAADGRVAAAARRSLTQIAARLTAIAQADAAPVAPGARIDIASSGEAVLVLAPASRSQSLPQSLPAPVRMAAAAPATIDAAVADRLGDDAALTIPMAAAEAMAEAPVQPPAPNTALPPAAPRRTAAAVPAPDMPAEPPRPTPPRPTPALPALRPAAVTVQRAWPAPLVLAQWRRADPLAFLQSADPLPPLPVNGDGKDAIRLAIARLESLIDLIEVQRG